MHRLASLPCALLALALVVGCASTPTRNGGDAVDAPAETAAPRVAPMSIETPSTAPQRIVREQLEQAETAWAEGRLDEAADGFETALTGAVAEDRVRALHAAALIRLSRVETVRDVAKARAQLEALRTDHPDAARRLGVGPLIALLDRVAAQRGDLAQLRKALAVKEEELKNKDAALEAVKDVLVDGGGRR